MKKLLSRFLQGVKGVPQTIRNHWRRLYDSPKKKMSRGSANIDKIISRPHNENWRRRDIKKPPKHK